MIDENRYPKVAVMLSAYNGEKYIIEQIKSILNQRKVKVTILVRDDGSTDNTISVLEQIKDQRLKVIKGKNVGPAKSFFELLSLVQSADYYAWSDQDDLWDEDKLIEAIKFIKFQDPEKPILYFGNNRIIDSTGKYLYTSQPRKNESVRFGQALIKSSAQGATFVFNTSLINVALKCLPDLNRISVLHDAWLHKVCLAVGGIALYDKVPRISYRIHDSNYVGGLLNEKGFLSRFNYELKGNGYCCSSIANEILRKCINYMDPKAIEQANLVANYKRIPFGKIKLILSTSIKTGNIKSDIMFMFKVLLGTA